MMEILNLEQLWEVAERQLAAQENGNADGDMSQPVNNNVKKGESHEI